jgi:nucleoside-diphosphate-sugar epimerase
MELNVIRGSHAAGVQGLLFKYAPQPIQEETLLSGRRESTNEWYATAKIAGLKMCQAFRRQFGNDYISAMPTNLYGLGDNYHPDHSHVPAALIRRFHEAKVADAPTVTVWGTGTPLREFLNVDDLADACVFLLKQKGAIRSLCHTPSAIRPLLGRTMAARFKPKAFQIESLDSNPANQARCVQGSLGSRESIRNEYASSATAVRAG